MFCCAGPPVWCLRARELPQSLKCNLMNQKPRRMECWSAWLPHRDFQMPATRQIEAAQLIKTAPRRPNFAHESPVPAPAEVERLTWCQERSSELLADFPRLPWRKRLACAA